MLFDAQLRTYPLSAEHVTERVTVTLKIRCDKQNIHQIRLFQLHIYQQHKCEQL